MRASALEFRLRSVIIALIVFVGFWAPWIQALDLGKRVSLLEWLALQLSRTGAMRFTYATPVVIVTGALLAGVGMVLRIWGTAHLGPGIVQSRKMHSDALMAGGPYRLVRNPLYLGTWFMLAALSFLMPPTGALFAMVLVTVFLVRLILGEEAYLAAHLGEAYRAYTAAVPRVIPQLRTRVARGAEKPRWLPAIAAELNAVSIFVVLAIVSWSYDHELMIKAVLIGFGVSLVARALVPTLKSGSENPA